MNTYQRKCAYDKKKVIALKTKLRLLRPFTEWLEELERNSLVRQINQKIDDLAILYDHQISIVNMCPTCSLCICHEQCNCEEDDDEDDDNDCNDGCDCGMCDFDEDDEDEEEEACWDCGVSGCDGFCDEEEEEEEDEDNFEDEEDDEDIW